MGNGNAVFEVRFFQAFTFCILLHTDKLFRSKNSGEAIKACSRDFEYLLRDEAFLRIMRRFVSTPHGRSDKFQVSISCHTFVASPVVLKNFVIQGLADHVKSARQAIRSMRAAATGLKEVLLGDELFRQLIRDAHAEARQDFSDESTSDDSDVDDGGVSGNGKSCRPIRRQNVKLRMFTDASSEEIELIEINSDEDNEGCISMELCPTAGCAEDTSGAAIDQTAVSEEPDKPSSFM